LILFWFIKGEWEVVISNTIPVEDHDPDEYEYEMEGITFMDLRFL